VYGKTTHHSPLYFPMVKPSQHDYLILKDIKNQTYTVCTLVRLGPWSWTHVSHVLCVCVFDRERAVRSRSSRPDHPDRSRYRHISVETLVVLQCLHQCVFLLQKAHRPSVYFSCSVDQTDEEPMQQQARHSLPPHYTNNNREHSHRNKNHCCSKPVTSSLEHIRRC